MECEYRLYNSRNNSYFDLIKGDLEPKQTKGLGLLLAKSSTALRLFLDLINKKQSNDDLKQIINLLHKPKKKKVTLQNQQSLGHEDISCVINCELCLLKESNGKIVYCSESDIETTIKNNPNGYSRADILIRFMQKNSNQPLLAILVEAKSISVKADGESVKEQLDRYVSLMKAAGILDEDTVPLLVSLTQNSIVQKGVISITWDDILNTYNSESSEFKKINTGIDKYQKELIKDYFTFLSKIGGSMKFYETEVLSIPARIDTMQAIINPECMIYECPATKTYDGYNKKALYLAFRESEIRGKAKQNIKKSLESDWKGGGRMTHLYKVEDIIDIDLNDTVGIGCLEPIKQTRIKEYIKIKNSNSNVLTGVKHVFFLDKNQTIELKPAAKPAGRNNANKAEYYLSDFFQPADPKTGLVHLFPVSAKGNKYGQPNP